MRAACCGMASQAAASWIHGTGKSREPAGWKACPTSNMVCNPRPAAPTRLNSLKLACYRLLKFFLNLKWFAMKTQFEIVALVGWSSRDRAAGCQPSTAGGTPAATSVGGYWGNIFCSEIRKNGCTGKAVECGVRNSGSTSSLRWLRPREGRRLGRVGRAKQHLVTL